MSSLPAALSDLMMAQQPIFDTNQKLFGYELLFRSNNEEMANVINGEDATSQVLVNLCIGITELEAQMQKPYFVNITRDLLLSDAFLPIDPNLIYIEILEDQKITPDLVEAVARWHEAGYRFALDDYHFDPSYAPLFPYVEIIKIDVLMTDPIKYKTHIQALRQRKMTLIAEKVEDLAMYQTCKELGFHLFQGYFLQRPNIIKGKRISSGVEGALELISELQNDSITTDKVSELISKNPTLSYQLLRVLNSPICGMTREVTDLKEAVVYIGLSQIKKWAMLLTITSTSSQPKEIFRFLLIRAKCCEALAIQEKADNSDADFMAGMMSGIDLILQLEKQMVFDKVKIRKEIVDAVQSFQGPIGKRLKKAFALEESNWEYIGKLSNEEKLTLSRSYGEASLWADGTLKNICS
ncbi:Intracellular signaling protein (EAL-mHD-GYP) [Marinomonas sp. MED121]|uniref:EAL and HDOD domain-containing protein n=1 Tax=Marinomonas sp. MED121 TaxID=314277 RepID=UPI000068FC14|nr:HDOD domain-containing protein [Marinomonas sp. MED121]EAQ63786.1 Intracellular signaling protein (EAL-mHD-GYP) [Marinomonas sp. MED121]